MKYKNEEKKGREKGIMKKRDRGMDDGRGVGWVDEREGRSE